MLDTIQLDRGFAQSDSDFAVVLRDYRREMGWTQAELAESWGYSFETVSAWERRKRTPSRPELPRLAGLLGKSEHELAALVGRAKVARPPVPATPVQMVQASFQGQCHYHSAKCGEGFYVLCVHARAADPGLDVHGLLDSRTHRLMVFPSESAAHRAAEVLNEAQGVVAC